MSRTLPRAEEGSAYLEEEKLVPGLAFDYSVRAEKGFYGDFPDLARAEFVKHRLGRLTFARRLDRVHDPRSELRHQFQLNGEWAVRAAIISTEGQAVRAIFNVYDDETYAGEVLMTVSGVILPRPTHLNMPHWHGIHPIQEGFATLLADPLVNTRPPGKDGLRYVIPARNIIKNSLKITHDPAAENGRTSLLPQKI